MIYIYLIKVLCHVLVPQVLAMMVDVEDEPDWSTSDDPDDDEDSDR